VTGLVMELVEGPTLADRIGQGPIPIDEALAIAKQIAEALEAAHEPAPASSCERPMALVTSSDLRRDGTFPPPGLRMARALSMPTSEPIPFRPRPHRILEL
jgi:hypothetical protein